MDIFKEGQKISAFVKNSNRIWEGVIIKRSDKTLAVLNESNTWKKLSDLEKIRLIEEETNYEDFLKAAEDQLDFDELGKDDKGIKEISKEISGLDLKGNKKEDEISADLQKSMIFKTVQDDQSEEAQGTEQGNQSAIEKYSKKVEDQIKESLSQLHPSLQPYLKESIELPLGLIKDLKSMGLKQSEVAQEIATHNNESFPEVLKALRQIWRIFPEPNNPIRMKETWKPLEDKPDVNGRKYLGW